MGHIGHFGHMGHIDSVVFFLWKFFIRVTQVTWVTPVTFDTFEPYHEPHMLIITMVFLISKLPIYHIFSFPVFAALLQYDIFSLRRRTWKCENNSHGYIT